MPESFGSLVFFFGKSPFVFILSLVGIRKFMAKKKLTDLSQTDGKSEESAITPSTLDQVWGDTGLWKYKSTNAADYKIYLDSLNKSDLQTHASKVGIIPSDNRDLLNQKLVKEFKRFIAAYNYPKEPPKAPANISAAIRKILEEGK